MDPVQPLTATLSMSSWLALAGIVALIVMVFVPIGPSGKRQGLAGRIKAAARQMGEYRPKDLLTANEAEFFNRLRQALPEDFYIFPQVAMSALIEPDVPPGEWMRSFARISQKRVDYAICDRRFKLIAIVELDDKTHDPEKDRIRDSYTASAGIKTIRWQSKNKPSLQSIMKEVDKQRRQASLSVFE